MKEFRKNEQGLFVCEECHFLYREIKGLCIHIGKKHNGKKYYDKWLKENGDGLCKICLIETPFLTIIKGYKNCCSIICRNKYVHIQTVKGCMKKYGCSSPLGNKNVREKGKQTKNEKYGNEKYTNNKKSKQTKKERYGDENYNNMKKNKQTKKERYGDENYNNNEKNKITCIEKYGNNHQWLNTNIREKSAKTKKERYGYEYYTNREKAKQTSLDRYGVEYGAQNLTIFKKGLKTRFLIHKYKDTNLTYQGSYELDFLNNFYDKLDIQNGPSIKYKVGDKNKVYHSDFYILSLNLIIEIKSMWTLKLDIDIDEKKKATIANDFNYCLILDKNYDELKIL